MPASPTGDAVASPETTIASLVDRVAQLEAMLAERGSVAPAPEAQLAADGARKPKGGPIDEATRRELVAKRERLELARLAEQAAWEDLKGSVRRAADAGVSYREIGDSIGVTRARVYQIVSGKR